MDSGPPNASRPSMRQEWHHLLFLHWTVPASELQPLLPSGLEVETFEGRAWVGLVPFTMTGVRFTWAPTLPGVSRFHEVNVRTYVHPRGEEPGVCFFSLDAANPLAVAGARVGFSLPYFYAAMELEIGQGATPEIAYRSSRRPPGPRPAGCALRYRPEGEPAPATPGTLEHFLVERYWLYTSRRGRLHRGRVRHTPYPLQGARVESWDETLLAAAGIRRPEGPPLAHYARSVAVDVFPLERVRP